VLAALLAPIALSASSAQFQGGPRLSLPSVTLGAAANAVPAVPALPALPTAGIPSAGIPALPALPAAAAPGDPGRSASYQHVPEHVDKSLSARSGRATAPRSAAGDDRPSAETESASGAARFDGAGPKAPGEDDSQWTSGRFESAAGGQSVAYKRRENSAQAPARVFAGGLALNESFEALLAGGRGPGHEYFVWTRGHPPTAWTPTAVVIDADARDLARMIVKAAAESKTGKAEVALHSFGTLVFQRLVQLRGEPEIDAALEALRGSRVFLLNATTHYSGSERRAGPELEQMGTATRQFVDWLDMMDATAAEWEAAARLNPFLSPAIQAWLSGWRAQRAQVLSLASAQAASMMKKDLETPWPPEIDAIRRRFLAALERDHRDGGWQEALLRRSADMFRLEFTKKDAAAIREAGIRLELVHAVDDQLLNWGSARALFEVLGIDAPEQAPAAGAVLTDRSGLFRARVVEGDHYFPLKRRDELARIMAK
jgi:hypothetical protein